MNRNTNEAFGVTCAHNFKTFVGKPNKDQTGTAWFENWITATNVVFHYQKESPKNEGISFEVDIDDIVLHEDYLDLFPNTNFKKRNEAFDFCIFRIKGE